MAKRANLPVKQAFTQIKQTRPRKPMAADGSTGQPQTLVADVTNMTFKQFKLLLRVSSNSTNLSGDDVVALVDTLDQCIVGGIDDLKVDQLFPIVEAVSAAIADANQPKN